MNTGDFIEFKNEILKNLQFFKMCCGCGKRYNPNEALGLPPGSNTAIYAYIIIITYMAVSSALVFVFSIVFKDITNSLAVFVSISSVATAVVTFYFHQKTTDKATKEIVNAHNNVLAARDREIELLTSINRDIPKMTRRKTKNLKDDSKGKSEETPLIIGDENA